MRNSELSMRSPKPLRWVAPLCATIGLAAVMLYCASLWTLATRGTSAEPVLTTPSRTGNSQRGVLESLAALKPGIPTKNQVAEQYGKLPLSFEINRGQSDSRVKFIARGNGYALFLTPSEAVFALSNPSTAAAGKTIGTHAQKGKNQSTAVLRMSLLGANPAPRIAALDELPGKSNYFIGNKPSGWHTDVPNYRKVAERDVYRGIDLIYYGTQRQLEYDFVVAPGADPQLIQLVFHGAKQLRTDSQGELVVSVAGGEVVLHKPVAYQEANGVRHPVAAEFAMKGTHTVAFQVGEYDRRLPVVIDPILSYSTYLGGSGIDVANGIAVASDGTAFVVGSTHSIDFPTTHSLQPDHGGGDDFPQDAFVTKLSADGKTLLYSTYLGGENQDSGNGIAVDSFGNAYVVGTTFSPHFPVTLPVFDAGCGGDGRCGATFNTESAIVSNAFVAKLNTAGSALIYSTFLGNYEDVTGTAIAVDADGNAYVTGQTTPMIDPTVTITPPAPAPEPFPIVGGFKGNTVANGFVGITNAYIAKFSPSGISLLYSSYIGGTSEDSGNGVAADSSGNAYVTGLANSIDFPVLGALQITKAGAGDAFLTKVNTTLTGIASLSYSTFIGGTGQDQGNGVAVDPTGKAYVVGTTKSVASTLGFTPPSGAVQPNCDVPPSPAPPPPPSTCQGDAFIAKFDTTATDAASLTYFTYLGGTLADQGNGIAFDTNGNAYVVGTTVSQDFPTTTPVFQPKYGGGNADAFVTKLDPAAANLLYSSYLGGSNTESGNGIAIDPHPSDPANPGAYVTGQTCSLDFPLSNPSQATPAGNCDAFISKVIVSAAGIALNPAGLIFPGQLVGSTSAAQTVTLNNGDSVLTFTAPTSITGPNAGDFAQTNTCGASVVAGGSCTFSVTFTPTAAGTRTASLTIFDGTAGSPHVVNLTGTGNPSPTVSVSPSSLAFGNQSVGTTSSSQAVTVTNTGTAALTFTGIVASGAFSQTNNCITALLQPSTNCVINVTFTPAAAGSSTGALTLTDNAPDSPQILLLTGTGLVQPVATVSPSSVGFGNQSIGSVSAAQGITLTNTGSGPLLINLIVATGDFIQANTCGSSLSVNASCAIGVAFQPTAVGTRTGTISITDNAPGSPQLVNLSGTGTPAPGISFAPTSLAFGNQPVGVTSSPRAIIVTNTGLAPLTISTVVASGDFAQANTCAAALQPTTTCTINVTFTPAAQGSSSGAITVTDNAPGGQQTVLLSGTGTGVNADFSITPSASSATVPAGQPASFAIAITSINGFSQQVTLSCSGLPVDSSCSMSPQSVTPTPGGTANFNLSVNTGLRTFVAPGPAKKVDPFGTLRHLGLPWFAFFILFSLMLARMSSLKGRRLPVAACGLVLSLVLMVSACSGGGAGTPVGTPAGTYQVVVTASSTGASGSITHTTTLTLKVN
jgi:hypothetical protein